MKQSLIIQPYTRNSSFSTQKLKWILIIVSVITIFLCLNIPVSAQTNAEEIQNSPYHSYLPIAQRGGMTYYVSPSGNDSNPGTYAHPWRTITKAADSVEPGSIVYIYSGTYHEKIAIYQNGTQVMPIRLSALPGQKPILDGENHLPEPGSGLISVYGDWVEISGIEVKNSNYVGIGLYGEHDTVSNVFVHHSQRTGVYINGDYGTVQDSHIWRNSLINEYGVSPNWSSGVASSRDIKDGITQFAIIRRNVVWENWGQGIDAYESDHVKIEDNVSHDNSVVNIYISDATNVVCQRNFVYINPSSYVYGYGDLRGIMIGDEGDNASSNITVINNISFNNNLNLALNRGTNPITNILIANNMFINSIETGGVILRGYHQNVIFTNNIIQQDGDLPIITIALEPEVIFSYNLWSKTPPSEAIGEADFIGNPYLSQTGDPYSPEWFMLTSLSPAIDGARALLEVRLDFFGNVREATPDMGAHEFFLP